MNAPLVIGDLVTVDEEIEALAQAAQSQSENQGQCSDRTIDPANESGGSTDNSDPQFVPPSVYEVTSYDLPTNTFTLKSKIGEEIFRTASHSSVIKLDEHLKQIANAAIAEHRECSPAKLGEDDLIPVNDLDPDAVEEAKRRTGIISRHRAKINPISKEQAIEELKLGPTAFHKIKRIFLTNPDWRAQLPGRSGRRSGENRIDPEVDEIIFDAFKTHRINYGANDAEALDEIELRCKDKNKKPPSRTTVWRRWKSLSAKYRLSSSDGPEAASAKFDDFQTPSVEEFYPGRIHEIDHTPLDCHGIDSKTGETLGRPRLTLVRDKDTEGIYGFALLFGAPKRASISAAVHMALSPKANLLAKHGMSHLHWPLYGKPRQYVVDHGSDLMAYSFRDACKQEEIFHIPRLRPQSGGGIERGLGILNRRLSQTLDGATASAPKKGPGYKPESKATYTLEALTAILIAWICKWNNRKGRDGLSPNERFERKYGLHDGVVVAPPTIADPNRFVIDILQGHEITVGKNGVVTRDLVYEFGPFKKMVGETIMIKVDPNNLHRIWGRHGDHWHPLKLVNAHAYPKTLSEQKLILKSRRQNKDSTNKRLDAQAELNRVKDEGKKQARAIRRAQEDVAQIERMGHFGDPLQPSAPDTPKTTKPLPVVIMEMDEDL